MIKTDEISDSSHKSIYLAVPFDSKRKINVIDVIQTELNKNRQSNIQGLASDIHTIKYNDFDCIRKGLPTKKDQSKSIIIFVGFPSITVIELEILKKDHYVYVVLTDIPEHFNTVYRYCQYLFDGIIAEEVEYKSIFDTYGIPCYDGTLFCDEVHRVITDKRNFNQLIPFTKRLYDFTFVGRFDRPGRLELCKDLEKYFPNSYFLDSTKKQLSITELNNIINNTRYFLNLTTISPFNTYRRMRFPEYHQLQRKSRLLEYAVNGTICFSELLPQEKFTTLNDSVIPVITIPRGVHVGKYCKEYIESNFSKLEKLSKETYLSVANGYNINSIQNFFDRLNIDCIEHRNSNAINAKEIAKSKSIYCEYNIYKTFIQFLYFKSSFLSRTMTISKKLTKHCRSIPRYYIISSPIRVFYRLMFSMIRKYRRKLFT